MGQIPVTAVAHHQLTEGGGVGEGEEIHILSRRRGGGKGPEEQLRADGDANARFRHGEGRDGVFRLQNQLGTEIVAVEIVIHDVAGAVAFFDENKNESRLQPALIFILYIE